MAKTRKKKGGRWLTALIVVLIVAGIAVMAYPFLLTQYIQYEKNQVVRSLEAELPIHRDETEFEAVDIAALPVVDAPVWTREEIAQAGQPQQSTTLAEVLSGQDESQSIVLAQGSLPTLMPQAADPAATLPPRSTTQATVTAAPSQTTQATGAPKTQAPPTQPSRGIAETATPTATAAPIVAAVAESAAPSAMPATEAPVVAVAEAQITTAPAPLAGANEPAESTAVPPTGTPEVPPSSAPPSEALQTYLAEESQIYIEDFDQVPQRANELNESLSAQAEALSGSETSAVPEEVALTFQSMQSRLLAMQGLLNLLDTLPSASDASATFDAQQGDDPQQDLPVEEGLAKLRENLGEVADAHVAAQWAAAYPDALDDVNTALDEIVQMSDQLQNQMDHLASSMSEGDIDQYLRLRAASLVGETEALYLMEIPSIDLKVGVFQNLTFQQMYTNMRKGAALFPRMGAPNANTNLVMSAHRSGSSPFFADFDKLQYGDEILLHTRTLGSFRYLIEEVFIIEKDDWGPTQGVGYPVLTLLSCEQYEGVSSGRRIVVRAQLVGIAR